MPPRQAPVSAYCCTLGMCVSREGDGGSAGPLLGLLLHWLNSPFRAGSELPFILQHSYSPPVPVPTVKYVQVLVLLSGHFSRIVLDEG